MVPPLEHYGGPRRDRTITRTHPVPLSITHAGLWKAMSPQPPPGPANCIQDREGRRRELCQRLGSSKSRKRPFSRAHLIGELSERGGDTQQCSRCWSLDSPKS
jgi:hypothetical protein